MLLDRLRNSLALTIILLFAVNASQADESVFPGSGNEADGIDELMVYTGIDSSALMFNLGNKRSLRIRYGENIDRTTFSATVNGVNISKKFHPVANTEESVSLRLKLGMNDLSLSISDLGDSITGRVPLKDQDDFTVELRGPATSARSMTTPPPGIEKVMLPPAAATNSNRPIFIDKSIR